MKEKILFDAFPAYGHITAFLQIAEYLREEYECVFIGPSDYAELVTSKGFVFLLLNPFPIEPESLEVQRTGLFSAWMNNLLSNREKRLKSEYDQYMAKLTRLLKELDPAVVLVDDHYALKGLVYLECQVRILTIQTMVSPIRIKGLPPFQSDLIPNGKLVNRSKIELSWVRLKFLQKINKLKWLVITNGQLTGSFYKKRLLALGYETDSNRCFGIGVNNVPRIINGSALFSFSKENSVNEHFFYRAERNLDEMGDLRLKSIVDKNKPIIYCSLGTVTMKYAKKCTPFFNLVIAVAMQFKEYQFVLSVGKDYDLKSLSNQPNNVSIFLSLSQQSLLPHTTLMISHGGLNSIKECISLEVPMMIFPLSYKWDQPGNGARVKHLEIGGAYRMKGLSKKKLRRLLHTNLNRLSHYREHIKRINKAQRELEKAEFKKFKALIYKRKQDEIFSGAA
ncbi:MAG: hypothetical protein JXQ90_22445 [Cyclobacteriaceae bacterium]